MRRLRGYWKLPTIANIGFACVLICLVFACMTVDADILNAFVGFTAGALGLLIAQHLPIWMQQGGNAPAPTRCVTLAGRFRLSMLVFAFMVGTIDALVMGTQSKGPYASVLISMCGLYLGILISPMLPIWVPDNLSTDE